MKKKAITKKVVVKNKAFIAAIKQSSNERTALHTSIAKNATKTGVVKLLQVSSKPRLATAK